jgi:hypothetical protein
MSKHYDDKEGVEMQLHSISISILLGERSLAISPFCPVVAPETMTIDRCTV